MSEYVAFYDVGTPIPRTQMNTMEHNIQRIKQTQPCHLEKKQAELLHHQQHLSGLPAPWYLGFSWWLSAESSARLARLVYGSLCTVAD